MVCGNGGSAAVAPYAYAMEKQARVISAASSVVSAGSQSSSSTKSSSVTANSSMGAAAPILEKKENDAPAAPAIHHQHQAKVSPPTTAAVPAPAVVSGIPTDVNPMILQMGAPPHPVAEFLFQLTKMLTDNNSEYIEWRNASIFVHDPPGLEKDILPKYFRHSNYSSFQRQMNYFCFRKIAGKGKMAPCSYVNENAKEDISSLLFIKRKKTGVSSAAAKLMAQQNRINRSMGGGMNGMGMGGNASLMMGGALGGMGGAAAALSGANQSISLNNFSMMGGVGGAGNMMSAVGSIHEQASLLREQQNMLVQLQQAHASALTNGSMGMGGAGQGGIPQATQNKLNGLVMNNGGNNTSLMTNDQGNLYMSSSNNPNGCFNPADAAAAQSLLFQQAAQQAASGLAGGAGNFSQGMGVTGVGDSNNVLRVDSAANLRALINQQISVFNTPAENPFASSTMNNLGAPLQQNMQCSAGMVQPQVLSSQQTGGLTSIPSGNNQGLTYDLNELLQRTGGMDNANASAGATAALQQFQQQLLQGSNNVALGASAAPVAQSFNLGGLFGTGVSNQ
eukprot:CAMPEP_0172319302 /NCGR_PEP_ID=MMETSP1058-20130122/37309_1 /TAXON_ID=83371 /ORGANISM="Detonula confervacea, Strain CCMP 353" /LENGTH=562 /DNA_ID=CAMNT_0013034311 /DNA_START=370 /DNA_END=2058 /DNA_ORIENTATION=+